VAPYHQMVGLLVAQKQFADAIAYAERAKGRALLDVLIGGRVNITRAMTAPETRARAAISSTSSPPSPPDAVGTVKSASDEPRLAELRGQLERHGSRTMTFRLTLCHPSPAEGPARAGQAGDRWRRPDTSSGWTLPRCSSTWWAEEKSYLFVLTRRSGSDEVDLEVHTIALGAADLARQAQKVQTAASRSAI